MEKSLEFIKRNYSPLVLAYLGDSFFELIAREKLIADGNTTVAKLNESAKIYVTAVSQSRMAGVIMDSLDETEMWFYKTGRNTKNTHHSRSALTIEYRRATGLECLFGYLYLAGKEDRARELFELAANAKEGAEK